MPPLKNALHEQFAIRLVAGESPGAIHAALYPESPVRADRRELAGGVIARRAEIQARVNELRAPSILEAKKKFEYSLEQANEDIDRCIQFARVMMQPATELKAIELKAKLAKKLGAGSETAAPLGDLSTEELLDLQTILRERHALRAQDGATGKAKIVKLVK